MSYDEFMKYIHIVHKALAFSVNDDTVQLVMYDDLSGRFEQTFSKEKYFSFSNEVHPYESACQWFFEDYECRKFYHNGKTYYRA